MEQLFKFSYFPTIIIKVILFAMSVSGVAFMNTTDKLQGNKMNRKITVSLVYTINLKPITVKKKYHPKTSNTFPKG